MPKKRHPSASYQVKANNENGSFASPYEPTRMIYGGVPTPAVFFFRDENDPPRKVESLSPRGAASELAPGAPRG